MTYATAYIGADGTLRFIYDDELAGLLALGEPLIARASHVEPTPLGWFADMSPSGGETLGPFPLRGEALSAEVEWLRNRVLEGGVNVLADEVTKKQGLRFVGIEKSDTVRLSRNGCHRLTRCFESRERSA